MNEAQKKKIKAVIKIGEALIKKYGVGYYNIKVNSRLSMSLGHCAYGSSPEQWKKYMAKQEREKDPRYWRKNPWDENNKWEFSLEKPYICVNEELALQGTEEQIKGVFIHEIVHALGINGIETHYKKEIKGVNQTEIRHSKKFYAKLFEISGITEEQEKKAKKGAVKPRYEYKCLDCGHPTYAPQRIKKRDRGYIWRKCSKCEGETEYVKDNKNKNNLVIG